MLSIKNIQFSKLLKADGRLREFNFRRFNSDGKTLFEVDVVDERNKRIEFCMGAEENTWKILSQPLPEWILENENKLHELIEIELAVAVVRPTGS